MSKKKFCIWSLIITLVIVFISIYIYASVPGGDKVHDFYRIKCVLSFLNLALSIFIPWILLFSGFSKSLEEFSVSHGGKWYISFLIYSSIFIITYFLISIPIDFYSGYTLKHVYGLSNQSILRWLQNYTLDTGTYIVGAALFLWIPFAFMKKSPKRWWFYTSLIMMPILYFSFMLEPVLIEPMYNDFKPLANKELDQRLTMLTKKVGINNCTLLQVDASRDTTTMNAYMTGVGKTKRIVIWDNTIKKLDESEIEFIAAHEIGHYVLGHVWKSMVLSFAAILITLYIVSVFTDEFIARCGKKLRINKLGSLALLPLFILIINITMLITVPASNAVSRYMETSADTFALELTKDNSAAISSFEKMTKDSITLKNPGIIYKFWNYDHPTMGERIEFCKNYKPWESNEPLKYGKYILK